MWLWNSGQHHPLLALHQWRSSEARLQVPVLESDRNRGIVLEHTYMSVISRAQQHLFYLRKQRSHQQLPWQVAFTTVYLRERWHIAWLCGVPAALRRRWWPFSKVIKTAEKKIIEVQLPHINTITTSLHCSRCILKDISHHLFQLPSSPEPSEPDLAEWLAIYF